MAHQQGPKIEVTRVKQSSLSFILSDTDTSMANALRRIMIAEVPTITIDHVEIYENSSVLSDEFLAHRLGLIPMKSQRVLVKEETPDGLKPMYAKTECACEGECSNCTVEFNLYVKNETDETLDVTTRDLRSNDPKVMPVDFDEDERIIIVKLKKNQVLSLKARAVKGVGRTHSKWSPVATAVFRYDPDIKVNAAIWDKMTHKAKEEWVNSCPRRVFSLTPDYKVDIVAPGKCIFCDQCKEAAEDLDVEDLVSVKTKPARFLFKVETTGCLEPKEIVQTALSVLGSKLRAVRKALNTDKEQEDHGW